MQSLHQPGKTENTIMEMKRLNISILGVSDTRWRGSGKQYNDEHVIYYLGQDTDQHRYGVGKIINKNIEADVKTFTPLSERIVLLHISAKPVDLNILQIYAPTADKDEDTIEEFYSEVENVMKNFKNHCYG